MMGFTSSFTQGSSVDRRTGMHRLSSESQKRKEKSLSVHAYEEVSELLRVAAVLQCVQSFQQ
jgi:hypothetical protein